MNNWQWTVQILSANQVLQLLPLVTGKECASRRRACNRAGPHMVQGILPINEFPLFSVQMLQAGFHIHTLIP